MKFSNFFRALFCYLVFIVPIQAQKNIDSLQISKLISESEDLSRINGPVSLSKIDSALLLFEQYGFSKDALQYGYIMIQWGYLHGIYDEGGFEKSIRIMREATNLMDHLLKGKDRIILARAWQKLGRFFTTHQRLDEAKICFQKSVYEREQILPPMHIDLAIAYQGVANVLSDQGNYVEAYDLFEKAYSIFLKNMGRNHKKTMAALYDLGRTRSLMGDKAGALDIELEVYHYFSKTNPQDLVFGYICNSLGNCYHSLGDFDRAILYYEKALVASQDPLLEGKIFPNIGLCYAQKGDYLQANRYFELGLQAFSSKPANYSNRIELFLHQAENDLMTKRYDKVQIKLDALRDTLVKYESPHHFWHRLHDMRGQVYLAIGQPDLAAIQFKKNILVSGKHPTISAYDMAENYFKLSLCYSGQEALPYIDSAVLWSGYRLGTRQKQNFTGVPEYYGARVKALVQKTGMDMANQAFQDIEKACMETMQALAECRDFGNLDGSKQYFSKRNQSVVSEVVGAILHIYDHTQEYRLLDLAFQYAGEAKSISLRKAVERASVFHIEGIPDSLILLRQYAVSDLAWIESNLWEQRSKFVEANDTLSLLLLQQHAQKTAAILAIEGQLEQYPEWSNSKANQTALSIAAVQQELLPDKDHVLMQFVMGIGVVYQFIIRQDTAFAQKIKVDDSLQTAIEQFSGTITAYKKEIVGSTAAQKSKKSYIEFGQLIYEKLIAPIRTTLRKDVLLVADGALDTIPFDALLTHAPLPNSTWKTYPYLIRDFVFHYAWTPALQHRLITAVRHPYDYPVACFAPFANQDTAFAREVEEIISRETGNSTILKPLPFSYPEVEAIAKLLKGNFYLDTTASLSRFLSIAPHARILHMASHAEQNNFNGDYGYVVFYPDTTKCVLYAREIYAMHIPAELVVLSTCYSGNGTLGGEDLVSIARSFVWAGAKSVISSAWGAHDAGTERLMVTFYQHLKKGKGRGDALHQAKLSMIKGVTKVESERYKKLKVDADRFAHPSYWAGFHLFGCDGPIF